MEEDALLSLDAHILWPLDEAGQVLGLLDITTDAEVSWVLLEKRLSSSSLVVTDNHLLGNLLDLSATHMIRGRSFKDSRQSLFYSAGRARGGST